MIGNKFRWNFDGIIKLTKLDDESRDELESREFSSSIAYKRGRLPVR